VARLVQKLAHVRVRAGRKIMTERKLRITPLTRFSPVGADAERMNRSARKPATVVPALAATAVTAFS
jgi:hypothetical protein